MLLGVGGCCDGCADGCATTTPLHPHTQCVEMVLGLISDSLDAWRTRQYDYYQRVLNGIL